MFNLNHRFREQTHCHRFFALITNPSGQQIPGGSGLAREGVGSAI